MYNTVGETAGVTQDVGSDPTVCDPFDLCGVCCTLCGREMDGSCEEEDEEGFEGEEMDVYGEGDEKAEELRVTVFDLKEMSRMEDDEDLDEEAKECSMEEQERAAGREHANPDHKTSS